MENRMKKVITLAAALALISATPAFAANNNTTTPQTATTTTSPAARVEKVDATKMALRDLWIGHIFWERNMAVAELGGNKIGRDVAEKEVVANAHSIAGAIEPFYGAEARDKLFNLLAGHHAAVKAYLNATAENSTKKQKDATDQLLKNADDIATFLSSANPNLPKDTLLGLLQGHGGHHMSQIQQLKAKDYASEAKTWSDMSQHMYVIADALADGLAKQFPDKFQ
jgi:hypothetical protein